MKEHRELQTLIDQLEAHIKAQAAEIERLSRDAEFVRQDERDKCARDYLQDCCDAVDAARLEEREACAQLCDEWFAGTAAKSIRERGKPDPAFKHFIDDKWSGIV